MENQNITNLLSSHIIFSIKEMIQNSFVIYLYTSVLYVGNGRFVNRETVYQKALTYEYKM